MSRIAKAPITIPEGVNITQAEGLISVKGKLGEMTMHVNSAVLVSNNDNVDLSIDGSLKNRNLIAKITGDVIDLSKNVIRINDKAKDYYLILWFGMN